MVLDGLEEAVHRAVPRKRRINFVRYAGDFIITGESKTIPEDAIRPVVENFLAGRGLELSTEKTVITHIKDGFTFLGQTFRKHGRVLHITPSTKGVHALMQKKGGDTLYRVLRTSAIRIRRYVKIKTDANPYLREYARYFWYRRYHKESKLLPAMSARQYRAMVSA
jgi:RNA-directed DNA polymerase